MPMNPIYNELVEEHGDVLADRVTDPLYDVPYEDLEADLSPICDMRSERE